MFKRTVRGILGAATMVSLVGSGCATDPAGQVSRGARAEPVGLQLVKADAALKSARFNLLLDFEAGQDLVFVTGDPARGELDGKKAHTGKSSLKLPAGTRGLTLNLPALVTGTGYPSEWNLVGAYLYSDQPREIVISQSKPGGGTRQRKVTLDAGQWTPATLDVRDPAVRDPAATTPEPVRFTFDGPANSPVWVDDFLLLDNTRSALDGEGTGKFTTWSIVRRGHAILIDSPGHFRLALKTPEAEGGEWVLQEAGEMRARLVSAKTGQVWTIYSDGREYLDGVYSDRLTTHRYDPDLYVQQQRRPAEVDADDSQGEVDRYTAGDANNDGYNEARASYEIKARGPRVEVTLRPRSAPLYRAVIEIAGLPKGKVVANLEGELVERVARTSEGNVLVELPGTIARPTTVYVRVQ